MTRDQFINEAKTYPDQISIWYSDNTEHPNYYIKGIAIPTIDPQGQDILGYLQQSTELTIEIQVGIVETLPVTGGELLTADNGTSILYFLDVSPYFNISSLVLSPSFQTTVALTRIIFSNTIDTYVFNASGYNAVLNNVQDPRLSDYQVLQGTTTQAGIQDSLYSSTGWINGRYEGSQTSQTNYLGISPTITGKSFEGVYFPRTVTDAQIIAQVQAGAVTYTEYLYPGEEALPTFTTISDAYYIAASLTSNDLTPVGTILATDTEIPLLIRSLAQLSTPIPKVGDIIQITSSLELMKVQSVGSYQNNGNYTVPFYKLVVERGYNYTTPQQIITQVFPRIEPPVNLSTPTLIFKLQGNKVQGVQRGKVQVKTSGEILHIDRFGYVVSGSNQAV